MFALRSNSWPFRSTTIAGILGSYPLIHEIGLVIKVWDAIVIEDELGQKLRSFPFGKLSEA